MARQAHAFVAGRVQGVGFRHATWQVGRRLGLRGWVRNRPDGTVEVAAEGDESALRELEAFLRAGPRGAHVTRLDFIWEEALGDLDAFEIR